MKRCFLIVMAFVVFLPMNPYLAYAATNRLPFDDIRRNYATEAIVNMSNNKIITGTGIRAFEPDKPVTRAEFVTMLIRLLGIEPVSSAVQTFTDVPGTAWFYPWVQPAIQLNLVNGVSDVRFEPARTVTREEAAAMLNRALKQLPLTSPMIPESLYRDQ
ncbi:MAG: S-layer homology domain-containing protein, partial [Cohnella sp.]|nr:S-layer homology domain-containing protein [Cohnella sp.]